MAEVAAYARHGFDDADIALRELIAEKVDRGEALQGVLAGYSVELLHPRRPSLRGRKKTHNLLQDIVIVTLIMVLIERFGLKPRRNPLSKHPSACSIAEVALKEAGLGRGGEDSIRKILERYSPSITPGWM